jgi:dUTP pyrophosphatase
MDASNRISVPIKRLPHSAGLDLPAYATSAAAGLDLLAAVPHDTVIAPGAWTLVPTGIAIALPPGCEAQVRPRSGLALKSGVTVLNSPGTIDADYRGEIGVILVNHGQADFTVTRGLRVAQLVIAPVTTIVWRETATLPDSQRGGGGFGSTGR